MRSAAAGDRAGGERVQVGAADRNRLSDRDWASCEAGAAERRLLLGSATTRECQMGTCKKKPQRDRGPRVAQVQSPCPILFCRHTAPAQGPSQSPCLLDKCAVGGCRLPQRTRPRIGNRFGSVRRYRQQERANNGFQQVSADLDRPARTDWSGSRPSRSSGLLPRAATGIRPRSAVRGVTDTWGTEQTADSGETASRVATSGVGTQPPDPDADATPEPARRSRRPGSDPRQERTVVDRSAKRSKPAHKRTFNGTPRRTLGCSRDRRYVRSRYT